ncbi:DNA/RNA nuclease SfsA [Parahaliea sp. F7430]|uniref:Sugar fermentation stimulation protein homolog n=1 Tax=Sediminihaliea albiluteola TaxID=2758564 RepID=A0A7W2TW96_9GAMM|nr:DNA/RNA nuclease SfsA [Sediminihaliea albiluteola]MBA6413087.1 DNA/RNA nuclease SfsA [Sediminihaliea albiluteola]
MEFGELIQGRLLRRYKRFLADVELPDGEVITVHCPNTGAMTGCMPEGAAVWLSTSRVKTRKYPQTWELVDTPQGLACIHSALANKVVQEGIEAGRLEGFEGYPLLRREVKYGTNSRADFLLEGEAGRVFIEVKCVTLCREGAWGAFPDAVSERGRKHIRELQAVRDEHTRSLLLFCVFHSGVQRVCVAGDIDPAYRDTLAQAMDAGLEVQAYGSDVSTAGLRLAGPLPFSLDPD